MALANRVQMWRWALAFVVSVQVSGGALAGGAAPTPAPASADGAAAEATALVDGQSGAPIGSAAAFPLTVDEVRAGVDERLLFLRTQDLISRSGRRSVADGMIDLGKQDGVAGWALLADGFQWRFVDALQLIPRRLELDPGGTLRLSLRDSGGGRVWIKVPSVSDPVDAGIVPEGPQPDLHGARIGVYWFALGSQFSAFGPLAKYEVVQGRTSRVVVPFPADGPIEVIGKLSGLADSSTTGSGVGAGAVSIVFSGRGSQAELESMIVTLNEDAGTDKDFRAVFPHSGYYSAYVIPSGWVTVVEVTSRPNSMHLSIPPLSRARIRVGGVGTAALQEAAVRWYAAPSLPGSGPIGMEGGEGGLAQKGSDGRFVVNVRASDIEVIASAKGMRSARRRVSLEGRGEVDVEIQLHPEVVEGSR